MTDLVSDPDLDSMVAADLGLPDLTGEQLVEQLREAVETAEAEVPNLAVLADLNDALELLGQLQALGERLAVVIGQTERDLDQRGAKNRTALPSGAVVTVEPGSLSYSWVPPRDVLKVVLHDLIEAEDPPSVWAVIDRVEAAVPAGVQWKAAGVRPYADPDELRASKRSRRRVKVALPGTPAPADPPADPPPAE